MDLHYFKWTLCDIQSSSTKWPTMLVFLHGMGGTGQIWRPIAASLESDYLCIAPDQRGHGQSRPLPVSEVNAFHATDFAKDVISLLDKLVGEYSPERIFLIGHSMGVRTALATAAAITSNAGSETIDGGTIKKLRALLKGMIAVDIGLQSKWGGGIGMPLADFIRDLPQSFDDRRVMRDYLNSKCPDPAIAQYLAAVAKKVDEAWVFPFDHEALVQTIVQAGEMPVKALIIDQIHSINEAGVPILALRGANSKVWLKEDYENQKKEMENPLLIFEEWENCGHGLPFEQRLRFIERVREFVNSSQ